MSVYLNTSWNITVNSYSAGPGIYGSKRTESEGEAPG